MLQGCSRLPGMYEQEHFSRHGRMQIWKLFSVLPVEPEVERIRVCDLTLSLPPPPPPSTWFSAL